MVPAKINLGISLVFFFTDVQQGVVSKEFGDPFSAASGCEI